MKYLLITITILLAACDNPTCRNKNEVFSSNTPNSSAYNEELVRLLNKCKAPAFFINSYDTTGGKAYVILDVHDNNLCAKMWLDVTDATDAKINLLKAKRGVSFRGAGFRNLQYQVSKDSNYHFIYQHTDGIID